MSYICFYLLGVQRWRASQIAMQGCREGQQIQVDEVSELSYIIHYSYILRVMLVIIMEFH